MNEEKNNEHQKNIENATTRTRVTLEKVLPDNRVKKLKDHLETIKAYSVASSQGKNSLRYSDFKGLVSFHEQKVSGLNKFLEYLGLIDAVKGKKGYYIPTKNLIEYQKLKEWKDEEGAQKVLRSILSDTWFYESVKNLLQMKGKATKMDLTQRLGVESGATTQYQSSLKILVDYLVEANLIIEDNGEYCLADYEETPNGNKPPLEDDKSPKFEGGVMKKDGGRKSVISKYAYSAPISININIPADASEQQIDTIFKKIKEHFIGDEIKEE
jgi:hypothetical protein